MALTRRQFLRRSALAVAGAGLHQAGAVSAITLTGPPWSSWMQGALSSGLRAVKEINEGVKV